MQNILLFAQTSDLESKFLGTSILDKFIKDFKKNANLKIYSKFDSVRKTIPEDLLIAETDYEKAIEEYRKNVDNFFIITKLAVSNIDYEKVLAYHINHSKDCTIVLRNLIRGKTTPIYKLNEKRDVLTINKKRYTNCGVYLFNGNVDFKNCPTISAKIVELMEDDNLKGFVHAGYFNIEPSNNIKGFKKVRRKYIGGKNNG